MKKKKLSYIDPASDFKAVSAGKIRKCATIEQHEIIVVGGPFGKPPFTDIGTYDLRDCVGIKIFDNSNKNEFPLNILAHADIYTDIKGSLTPILPLLKGRKPEIEIFSSQSDKNLVEEIREFFKENKLKLLHKAVKNGPTTMSTLVDTGRTTAIFLENDAISITDAYFHGFVVRNGNENRHNQILSHVEELRKSNTTSKLWINARSGFLGPTLDPNEPSIS